MIELGIHDAYVSRTISLTGRQIEALSKKWPSQVNRYFDYSSTDKFIYADPPYDDPPYDQDSCFGRDIWINPELCECLLFPTTCNLDDPPSEEDYPPGGGDGGGNDDDGGDDDNSDDNDDATTCTVSDINLVANSEINYLVSDDRVYAGGRASSRVRISGVWDSCIYDGNAKVQAEAQVINDFNERTTLQQVTAGGLSTEYTLIFPSNDRVETEWVIDYPLQSLQRIELYSTHEGEYEGLPGDWTPLPTQFRLEVANF